MFTMVPGLCCSAAPAFQSVQCYAVSWYMLLMLRRLCVTALEKRVVPTIYLEEVEGGRWVRGGMQRRTQCSH